MNWKLGNLVLLGLLVLQSCSEPVKKPVNVLLILVDDLGWQDLGCYGATFYETPSLDSFARQSIQFNQAYASASICSPSRAALITGLYPTHFPITDWIPGQDPKNRPLLGTEDLHALPLSETTLAEALNELNYETFFAGKWHLGAEGSLPTDHGFTHNLGGHEKGSPPGGYYVPYKNPYLADGPAGEYLPNRLTTETIQFIERSQAAPFFAMLSFYTVHTPIQANKQHAAYFTQKANELPNQGDPPLLQEGEGITVMEPYNAAYGSMVKAMDDEIGRIVNALKELGLYDQTMIIFTSDNGGLSTLHQNRTAPAPTSVRPLRGGKGWLYEGGIRVPLLIKPPFWKDDRHEQIDTPVAGHDLMPTILDVVSDTALNALDYDGFSLKNLWETDEPLNRRTLFWHYPHYHGSGWTPGTAIRSDNWKLIYWYESDHYELYDLSADLSEATELSATNPQVFDQLKDTLSRYHMMYGTSHPTVNPNYSEPVPK